MKPDIMKNTITKILTNLTMCAVAITAYQSRAEEKTKNRSIVEHWQNIYLRVDVGKGKYVSKMKGVDKRPKLTHVFGYGIGYNLPWNNMRVDISTQSSEFSVASNTQKLKDRTRLYMLNLYKGFALPTKAGYFSEMFMPYVTGGIGKARFKTDYITLNSGNLPANELRNNSRFIWNLGIGAQIKIIKPFSLDFCYKYIGVGKISTSSKLKQSRIDNQLVTAAVIMNFW